MHALRAPLQLTAAYSLLAGLTLLSRTLVKLVFGYTIIDRGMMLVLAGTFLGLGVILLRIARSPARYGEFAAPVALSLVISLASLAVAWALGTLTARTVLVPIVIDAALIVWIASMLARGRRSEAR